MMLAQISKLNDLDLCALIRSLDNGNTDGLSDALLIIKDLIETKNEQLSNNMARIGNQNARKKPKASAKATQIPTPKAEKSEYSEIALKSANYIAQGILEDAPSYRELLPERKEQTLQRWAADIEKLIRIDKADLEELKAVLMFIRNEPGTPFWKNNILSGAALRKHYPKLQVAMAASKRAIVEEYYYDTV